MLVTFLTSLKWVAKQQCAVLKACDNADCLKKKLSPSVSWAWPSLTSSQLQQKVNTSSLFLFLQFYHFYLRCLPIDLCDKVMINIIMIHSWDWMTKKKIQKALHLDWRGRPSWQLLGNYDCRVWKQAPLGDLTSGTFDSNVCPSPIVLRFSWGTLISTAEIIERQWGS